jgi:hypothetical protein
MNALHKIKSFLDRFMPFATKQSALALANPILKTMASKEAVTARLKSSLGKGSTLSYETKVKIPVKNVWD